MGRQSASLAGNNVGRGLRTVHIDRILRERPNVPWFEVLMDNHTAQGGLVSMQLAAVRDHYFLSLHCVGMSLGGANLQGMDCLLILKRMIKEYRPAQVSDHPYFTHYYKHHFNDLLPIPFTSESLHHVCDRIDVVQDCRRSRILVENLSSYLEFEASEIGETEFISDLVARTGCGILPDINNAYVNEFNNGYSATAFIDSIPIENVGEVYLRRIRRQGRLPDRCT